MIDGQRLEAAPQVPLIEVDSWGAVKAGGQKRRSEPGEPVTTQLQQQHRSGKGLVTIKDRFFIFSGGDDFFFSLLRMSWSQFIAFMALWYALISLGFAGLYCLQSHDLGDEHPTFGHVLFYSFQLMFGNTFGWVGPTTVWSRSVTVVHMFVAAGTVTVSAGTVFVKLSQTTMKLAFAQHAVIGNPDDIPTLTFRIANRRSNLLVDISVKATLITDHTTAGGEILQRTQALNFDDPPTVLSGDTTLRHRLGDESPLYGMTPETIRMQHVRIALVVTAIEETFNDTTCAFYMYAPEHILFNHRFARMRERNPEGSKTVFTVHMDKFDDEVPL